MMMHMTATGIAPALATPFGGVVRASATGSFCAFDRTDG
jgi:hypothetical protein